MDLDCSHLFGLWTPLELLHAKWRQFRRTNWENVTLAYLRHGDNIFPWEVGDVVQVILKFNLECHIFWINDLTSKFLINDDDIMDQKMQYIFS